MPCPEHSCVPGPLSGGAKGEEGGGEKETRGGKREEVEPGESSLALHLMELTQNARKCCYYSGFGCASEKHVIFATVGKALKPLAHICHARETTRVPTQTRHNRA